MILTHAFTFSWNAPSCKRRIRFTREQSAICRCREKNKGGNLSRVLHFSCDERPSSDPAIRPAPAPTAEVLKKYGRTPHSLLCLQYRSSSRISPLPLSAHRLCSPSSSWEKKPEFVQKKRHASVQSRINSSAFVRLFLTLGKNTLDYLSRINK
ncbi:MAG: hypothetical protein EGQ21_11935 [Akkermansia sp.]|nr:hypothetical protein [Akkermansia sp.]